MRVGFLGPVEVLDERGDHVPVGGAMVRALLVRLAVDVGRPVSVEALADALWPFGAGPADRVHALHSLVSRLRRALPDRTPLRSVPGGYLLALGPDAVDATRFERLAAAPHTLREALALWRGDLPPDVPHTTATRLRELRLAALEDLADADLATADLAGGADPGQVAADLRALVEQHPERERARALLLRALHADGRSAEALRCYEEFRSALADELGVDPSPELREAHLAVLREDNVDRRRGNLPEPLTGFVGRDRERALVTRRLAEHRLVTLTGPGGVGKTRLATTSAAGVPGAWLVELAAVTDPDEVPQAVLSAFGTRRTSAGDAHWDTTTRLVHLLSPQPVLLVLDNCEHLLDAVAALAVRLLGACPRLRLLTTSREPLRITGEALVPVPPLETAPHGPAVRLFTDRATAVRPDFTADAPLVAEICRRLDGLPLAIELAAAHVRSVPVEHLPTLLDDRFRLLARGSRTALPRHRTLRAVVDWSWALLADDERRLAEALAVFGGTITPDAAAHVGPADVPTPLVLSALVDKSLLDLVEGPEPRYRMLETIRAYGLERLAARAAVEPTRDAHARYFLALAETAAPHLRGRGQLRWLDRLTADRGNLLGALHHACATRDTATAVRLATRLAYYLTLQGDHAEAARLLRTALSLPGPTTAADRAPATTAFLINSVLSGDTADTGEVVDRFRALGDRSHPSGGLVEPFAALIAGDHEAGLAAVNEQQPHPAPLARAMLWFVRALLNDDRGARAESCRDLATAAEEFTALGERWGLVTSLTKLAALRIELGDPHGAIAALTRSLEPACELGGDARQRLLLATAHTRAGDPDRARAELRAVIATSQAAHHLAAAHLGLTEPARAYGDPEAAERGVTAGRLG
jgi:predicted ATPase/DNA-binding SARP family transcriptional activator